MDPITARLTRAVLGFAFTTVIISKLVGLPIETALVLGTLTALIVGRSI